MGYFQVLPLLLLYKIRLAKNHRSQSHKIHVTLDQLPHVYTAQGRIAKREKMVDNIADPFSNPIMIESSKDKQIFNTGKSQKVE